MHDKIINAINNNKVKFIISPRSELKTLILQNAHPTIQKLPENYKTSFLGLMEGQGIEIDRKIVRKYVTKQANEAEIFILDKCDIWVIDSDQVVKSSIEIQ